MVASLVNRAYQWQFLRRIRIKNFSYKCSHRKNNFCKKTDWTHLIRKRKSHFLGGEHNTMLLQPSGRSLSRFLQYTKRLGVFLLSLRRDASPSQGYHQHSIRRDPFIHLSRERHCKVYTSNALPWNITLSSSIFLACAQARLCCICDIAQCTTGR